MRSAENRRLLGAMTFSIVLTIFALDGLAAEATTQGDPMPAISARVDEIAASGELSGVVLVARNGEVLLEKAFGLARVEPPLPNTAGTRFNIGSITKVFTHVMILQLESEGLLELDDPIARHLDDYPDPEIAQQVTIQHLLDMSSGLGDIFGERYDATPKDEIMTLTDYLGLFAGQPLEFEPGTSKRYSNAGYIVLGLIIEELTGMTFDQALTTRVFKPAAMTGSAVLDRHSLGDEAATGYTRDGWMEEMNLWMEGIQGGEAPTGPRVPNTDTLPGRGSSAGGTYSTARDLLAFDRALAAGALCDTAYWRGYGGLGFAGGASGVNAALEADWDKGWTVVVLTNLDPPSAMRAARSIREILTAPAE